MSRFRVTVEAWTLVDVDVECEDAADAYDRAREKMAFPPREGWNSLDFDFKVNNIEPDQLGQDTDLLELHGEPWGQYDPDFDPDDQMRTFFERYATPEADATRDVLMRYVSAFRDAQDEWLKKAANDLRSMGWEPLEIGVLLGRQLAWVTDALGIRRDGEKEGPSAPAEDEKV